jgi:hypothetical protein
MVVYFMEFKVRTKPTELEILETLDTRMQFLKKDQQHYLNLKKGYEGELAFDEFTRELTCDCLVLNDLLLQVGSTTFQIDTLIIADIIYLFEVKNLDGDYYYDKDQLYTKSNYEILNPTIQISRSESLLRQLLHPLGITSKINSSVVFINPEFTLYQAPLDKPFILPTQVKRYIGKFNKINSRITNKHIALADKLVSLHLTDSPFTQLPKYEYGELRKGVSCQRCGSHKMFIKWANCVCEKCDAIEGLEDVILRNIREFRLLFPNEKITTNTIHNWCGEIASTKTISRILERNFISFGARRWTYFK